MERYPPRDRRAGNPWKRKADELFSRARELLIIVTTEELGKEALDLAVEKKFAKKLDLQ